MIIKFLIAILCLIILPELLGLLILKFWDKQKNNILLGLILGYIIEFSIAQLITVPMIFLEMSYQTLLILYTAMLVGLSVLSIILNAKRFKDMFWDIIDILLGLPKILTAICLILIVFQMYMYVGTNTHIDDDDAFYVGTATTTIETNTLYKYSATTGGLEGEHNIPRYRLGPFPIYYAIVSSWINIHPAIVAHVILPIIFIILVYSIYALLGHELFNKDLKNSIIFVLLFCFLNLFGNYSIRTTFTFLLFRIWQGKAVLCNIIIPLIFYMFLSEEKKQDELITKITLFLIVLAGVFTTTMGVVFPSIIIGVLGLLYVFYNKSIKNIFGHFLCCLPAICYGILYFIL